MVWFTGLAWVFAFLLLASNFFESRENETFFSWLFVIFNTTQVGKRFTIKYDTSNNYLKKVSLNCLTFLKETKLESFFVGNLQTFP